MVSVQNLSVEFGTNCLFKDVNFVINKKDKIALVGKNGAGKSTLLKIICGLQSPTTGIVSVPKDFTIGYLPQQMAISDHLSVKEEIKSGLSILNVLELKHKKIQEELSIRTDYDSLEYHSLIEELTNISEKIESEQKLNIDAEIERTLIGLGFSRGDLDRYTSEFSGGWRMRIELAKILLKKPDLILLDEPTNHLDLESILWLENYLKEKTKSVVLVSHDKAFIDNVTSRTIEISVGKIYDYNVNYSKFIELRKERIEQQTRAYLNQQKQIQETEDFIEKFRYKATKSVQVQSRIKQLSKIQLIEIDEIDNSKINLKFPPAPRSGDYPIIIERLAKSYGENIVIENVSFNLKRGEKVAFVGKNGTGKSTLVKCIMNEIPFSGELKIGHNVKIGYFAQNQAQMLDGNLSVFDTIDNIATGDIRVKIRDILGAFMFGGEASDKKVKVLSGGEKARLAMIRLLLEPVNLLILDEPTNHLDIKSKEVLKQAIKDFTGTAIIVSHDRDFLDGLVDKVYEFKNNTIIENIGGIDDFIAKRQLSSLRDLEIISNSLNSNNRFSDITQSKQGKSSINKNTYFEQREKEKLLRSAKKRITEEENKIIELEEEIHQLEQLFNEGGIEEDLYKKYAEIKKKLESHYSMWEIYSMELDEMKD